MAKWLWIPASILGVVAAPIAPLPLVLVGLVVVLGLFVKAVSAPSTTEERDSEAVWLFVMEVVDSYVSDTLSSEDG